MAKAVTKTNKPAKAAKPATPVAPATSRGGFGPPDWLNVLPEPIPLSRTLDAEIARAVEQVLNETADATVRALAERAPIDDLIALFTGPALTSGLAYWDDARVGALEPAEKRAQKKAYAAAENAKNRRERIHVWLVGRLATTPAGRAHLLSIAAGEHSPLPSARVRGFAAHALRDAKPDAALWRELGERVDPCRWLGTVDRYSSTYLGHTYAVGARGALISDPAGALARFAPLLDARVADTSEQTRYQATSIMWALLHLLCDHEVDPAPYAGFTPLLVELIGIMELKYQAMSALAHLPFEPAVAEAAARDIGPSPTAVSQFTPEPNVQLIARSSDPRYVPWLARALVGWSHWPHVFRGLANIGEPIGIAIIEAWLAANAAPGPTTAAAPILEALRAKGEPTEAQRAEAAAYLAPPPAKTKKKR